MRVRRRPNAGPACRSVVETPGWAGRHVVRLCLAKSRATAPRVLLAGRGGWPAGRAHSAAHATGSTLVNERILSSTRLAQTYLHSSPFSPTMCSKFSRLQEATYSTTPDQYTLWKVLHVNPQERLESEGEAVPVRTAVVLCHVCTSSLVRPAPSQPQSTPARRPPATAALCFDAC